jgi:hypothetical protein
VESCKDRPSGPTLPVRMLLLLLLLLRESPPRTLIASAPTGQPHNHETCWLPPCLPAQVPGWV